MLYIVFVLFLLAYQYHKLYHWNYLITQHFYDILFHMTYIYYTLIAIVSKINITLPGSCVPCSQ